MKQAIQQTLGFFGLQCSRKRSIVEMFENAVYTGDTQQVDKILMSLNEAEQSELMDRVSSTILMKPAQDNKLDILVMLLSVASSARCQVLIQYNLFQAPRMAAENGHANAVAMFLRVVDPKYKQSLVGILEYVALSQSAQNGNKHMVEVLLREDDPFHRQLEISYNNFKVYRSASANGHTGIVDLLLREVAPENLVKMTNSTSLQTVANAPAHAVIDVSVSIPLNAEAARNEIGTSNSSTSFLCK